MCVHHSPCLLVLVLGGGACFCGEIQIFPIQHRCLVYSWGVVYAYCAKLTCITGFPYGGRQVSWNWGHNSPTVWCGSTSFYLGTTQAMFVIALSKAIHSRSKCIHRLPGAPPTQWCVRIDPTTSCLVCWWDARVLCLEDRLLITTLPSMFTCSHSLTRWPTPPLLTLTKITLRHTPPPPKRYAFKLLYKLA